LKKLGIGRTRVVLALGAAVAAAAAVIIVIPATFGSFSDQTTNSGNSVALGTLLVTNSAGGASCTGALATSTCTAVMSISNLKPGDTVTNSVTLTDSGSLPGIYTMNLANVASVACTSNCGGVGGNADLKNQLNLYVTDGTNTIYGAACTGSTAAGTNPLSGFTSATTLPPTSGSSWASGEGHTYTFKVCVPGSLSNAYQGTSATYDIVTNGAQTAGVDH
jgi:spore coat-associated protein N